MTKMVFRLLCAFSTGIHRCNSQDIQKRTASILYPLYRRKDKVQRSGTELPTSVCKIVRSATLNANADALESADLQLFFFTLDEDEALFLGPDCIGSAGLKGAIGWWSLLWRYTAHLHYRTVSLLPSLSRRV